MAHPFYRVQAFEHVGAYAIRIVFDDQTEEVVDFRPVPACVLYGPLASVDASGRLNVHHSTMNRSRN
jgi:hypothetical protein